MTYAGDLTPQQTYDLLGEDPNAVMVDVRTSAEWSYVGVPDLSALGRDLIRIEWQTYPSGEVNAAFLEQLADAGVDPQTSVAFLCRSGVRSKAAAEAATAVGYERAYNISDGFEGPPDADGHRGLVAGWKADGLAWRQQ